MTCIHFENNFTNIQTMKLVNINDTDDRMRNKEVKHSTYVEMQIGYFLYIIIDI